jgi:prepilin-type N-terminal cleavage/methylation domain-containing protein/prepilin-type processing-associated H-X9-DG protein
MKRFYAHSLREQGFTLIELASVVAIVLILVSLLMAGITQGMQRAGLVNCQHNLRYLGQAIQHYTIQNSGVLPQFSEYAWAGQVGLVSGGVYRWKLGSEYPAEIQSALNLDPQGSYFIVFPRNPTETRVFRCPSAGLPPENTQGIRSSYTGLSLRDAVTVDTIENPATAILLVEYEPSPGRMIQADDHATSYTTDSIELPASPQSPIERYRIAANHSGGGNILFLDLHIEFARGDGLEIQTWEMAYRTTSTTSTTTAPVTTSTTTVASTSTVTTTSSTTVPGGGPSSTSTTSTTVPVSTSTSTTSTTSTTQPKYIGPPGPLM